MHTAHYLFRARSICDKHVGSLAFLILPARVKVQTIYSVLTVIGCRTNV